MNLVEHLLLRLTPIKRTILNVEKPDSKRESHEKLLVDISCFRRFTNNDEQCLFNFVLNTNRGSFQDIRKRNIRYCFEAGFDF